MKHLLLVVCALFCSQLAPAYASETIELTCQKKGQDLVCHDSLGAEFKAKSKDRSYNHNYAALSYQAGGEANYGITSRIKTFNISKNTSFSLRPSVFIGYNEDKVDDGFDALDTARNSRENGSQSIPEEIDPETLAASGQDLSALEDDFNNGRFDTILEDDDVTDYLRVQVNAVGTLDYNINRNISLYSGGGYSFGFYEQESAPMATAGLDIYPTDNVVINLGGNIYFGDDTTTTGQVGIGLTF